MALPFFVEFLHIMHHFGRELTGVKYGAGERVLTLNVPANVVKHFKDTELPGTGARITPEK